MEEKFICKIASPEEMDRKWDYEIESNPSDRDNWITWKAEAISGRLSGVSLPYYGILDETSFARQQPSSGRICFRTAGM